MGCFLDATIVIHVERRRLSATAFIGEIASSYGDESLAISAVVMTELLHGLYRESEGSRRSKRKEFFEELFTSLPVIAYTAESAAIAGRIGGEQAALGRSIPPVDLMIGATALAYDYSILTANERHFRMIPGLRILTF